MKNRTIATKRSILAAIFFGIVILSSCKKPESEIGLGLQGNQLSTQADTTLAINSYMVRVDSIKTDSLSYLLCGNYNDFSTGTTSSRMSFNLSLSTSEVNFGEVSELQVDSIVLTMKYSGYIYGRNVPQQFSVNRITSEFHPDSTYYSNFLPETDPENQILDENQQYEIDIVNDVSVDGQTWDPQLRLFLDPELGDYLFENFENGTWNDQESFAEFFKGLQVTSTTPIGSVVGYDVKDFDSRMTMYYRNTVDEDTLQYIFFVDETDATLTSFENDYAGLIAFMSVNQEIQNNQNLLIKAGQGVELRLELPDLSGVIENDRSINKADLVIPVDNSDISRFEEPVGLVVVTKDEDGLVEFLPDETAFGDYDFINNEYRFNISLYIQKVLDGEFENKSLYILPLSSGITVNRVLLKGPEYATGEILTNLRLELTSSK